MEPKRYKLSEAARLLGVKPATIRAWARKGNAPVIRSHTGKMFVPVEWVDDLVRVNHPTERHGQSD